MSAHGILTVCDANICRSVAAEFLLAEGVAARPSLAGVDVFSSGVNAVEGHDACRSVVELRQDEAWTSRAGRHQSRQLDAEAIVNATLILTATVQSRAAVVSLVPASRRAVFTLREALWLADGYRPPAEVTSEALVADFASYLDGRRGLRPLPEQRRILWRRSAHPFDIADGHPLGGRAHVATLRQVQDSVADLLKLMAPNLDAVSTANPGVR